jgi:hypothetical protein
MKSKSFEIIQKINAKKEPLEQQRVALWSKLDALLASIRDEEAAIRSEIKAVQELVKPLDKLMVDAAQAGKLTNKDTAAKLLAEIEGKL